MTKVLGLLVLFLGVAISIAGFAMSFPLAGVLGLVLIYIGIRNVVLEF
jgi:hypothetical protein